MSAWLKHVKKTMKMHPGKKLKDVLKLAAKTYKKTESTVEYAVTGKHKRTRRVRHKGKKGKKGTKGKKGKKSKSTSRRNKSSRRRRRR